MGILPNFNKIGSHRMSLGWNGTCGTAALLTYFSLVSSTPGLFVIIVLKVSTGVGWGGGLTVFFSSCLSGVAEMF